MPPGSGVAYIDGDGLRYIDGEGTRLLVPGLNEGLVYASPSGDWVAYRQPPPEPDNDVLSMVSTDTGDVRELVQLAELPYEGVAEGTYPDTWFRLLSRISWAPDGERLYFNTYAVPGPDVPPGEGPAILDDLWSVDITTGETTALLSSGEAGYFSVAPDGSRLAVTRSGWKENQGGEGSLWLMDNDGSNPSELLRFPRAGDNEEMPLYVRPTWNAEGDGLIIATFEHEVDIAKMGETDLEMSRVGLDGSVEQLGSLPSTVARGFGPSYFVPMSQYGTRLATAYADTVVEANGSDDSAGGTDSGTADATDVPPDQLRAGDLEDVSDWENLPAYDIATQIRLGDWSPDEERFFYAARRRSELDPSNDFYFGGRDATPLRVVENSRIMRAFWLGDDHVVLLLKEDSPWMVLVSVDGEMELLARLVQPEPEARISYAHSAVHP